MAESDDIARRNRRLGMICAGVFAAMVATAYAAVPLYKAFCQATGFAGTTQRANASRVAGPGDVSAATVTVRFDTNVNGLAWKFEPVQTSQVVHLGENKLAFFRATNTSNKPLTGRAVYNVTPQVAGAYFSKLECFCFKNQTLAPGQTAEFPVVYFVDKRFAEDSDTRGEPQITLSYTFFPAPAAQTGAKVAAASRSPLGGTTRARL